MKKSYTILILILSILAMAIAILLLIFFLKVIKNKNEHASAVYTTLQDKIEEKENARLNASKISEMKLIQNSINNYFVDPNKIDTFVGYLESIGVDLYSEVSVKSIEIPEKTKNTISVKLSILGTFSQVMNTIDFLENMPYQIDITQIYLNKDAKQIAQGDFNVVTKEKDSKTSKWQADVSFNILSLN